MRTNRPAPARGPARLFAILALTLVAAASRTLALDAEQTARSVTIIRDEWGVPHIDGPTDASCAFGVAYAQCEDYFWQVEDSYLQVTGRYSEAVGRRGLKSDMLNHTFEIVRRSQEDYPKMSAETRAICEAYSAGLNYFLLKHPEVKPRLLTHFEPWMVVAYGRFTMLYWIFDKNGGSSEKLNQAVEALGDAVGSNLWVLGPQRTRDRHAMLFVNPHQPWFGIGQWWEAHVRSGEGWNFSGSTFFGGPFPAMGHNENLGWAHTANKPDGGDVFRVTFDDPANPLNYRYDGGHRAATQWTDVIKVRNNEGGIEEVKHTFRKTHHGPIIARQDEKTFVACGFANMFETDGIRQALQMTKARNFSEFYDAIGHLALLMFNIGYADRDGNFGYIYNGAIPKRDPSFDWTKPVDGSDPRTEWRGIHPMRELPQIINPTTGYVQNCNQSPWTATDEGGPYQADYPPYMAQERAYDNRRAEASRHQLREMRDMTFEKWIEAVNDTTMHFPKTQMPRYRRELDELKTRNADLAAKAAPYIDFLSDWDFVNTAECTQSTLFFEWYEMMYGQGKPSEEIKPEFMAEPDKRFEALLQAVANLEKIHGAWKVPYGEAFRLQRHPNVADILTVPFKDSLPSVPCLGASGALGTSYNAYYGLANPMRKRRYGVVGASFIGVYEFGEKVRAMTVLQFGQSADPKSPHFFDQAKLFSEKKFKPAWFYWDEVMANGKRTYHPGG